jgi:thioredoxin 1
MMSEHILTKDNFSEITGSAGLVMVDFWATWCGPCRMLAPVVEKLAEERSDVTVGKVNVDEQQELASRYEVNVIPTLVFFRDGKPVGKTEGYHDRAALDKLIDQVLGK